MQKCRAEVYRGLMDVPEGQTLKSRWPGWPAQGDRHC